MRLWALPSQMKPWLPLCDIGMWPRTLSFMDSFVCVDCWCSFRGWDDRFDPINPASDQPRLGITGRFEAGFLYVRSIGAGLHISISRIGATAIGKSLDAPTALGLLRAGLPGMNS